MLSQGENPLNNKAPSISIIVPVFNCEPFLQQSLGSLHAQTWQDFEVIICDDASHDASVEVAQQWAKKDPRFKVFPHKDNVRMTANWNRALSYASGDYIMKLDADDAYNADTLERLVSAISQPDVDIAFCRTAECDDNLEFVGSYRGEQALVNAGINPSTTVTMAASDWYQLAFNDLQIWHSNAFIVSAITLKSLGGWDEQFGCASDTDLIYRLLELDAQVQHVDYVGVLYRMREGSVSHDFRANDKLVDEGYIASLNSLNRFSSAGKRLSYRAKLNWYRIYLNAKQRIKERGAASSTANNESVLQTSHCKIPSIVKFFGAVQRFFYELKKT